MKRHNRRGRLIVALLLALILPILAACGGGQLFGEIDGQRPELHAAADGEARSA